MAKKLFAFLGIGDYKSVEYYFQNKKEGYKTEYIQEAITKLLNEQDLNVTVFVTAEARKKHWEPENNKGLESRLKKLNINCKAVNIPDGKQTTMYGKYSQVYIVKLNLMMKYMLM